VTRGRGHSAVRACSHLNTCDRRADAVHFGGRPEPINSCLDFFLAAAHECDEGAEPHPHIFFRGTAGVHASISWAMVRIHDQTSDAVLGAPSSRAPTMCAPLYSRVLRFGLAEPNLFAREAL
jgi:hypothetical protein